MTMRFGRIDRFVFLWAALLMVCGGTGCSFSEAVVDGVFGGISDIVATIISETALASLPAS